MNGAGSKPLPSISPLQAVERKWITWLASTQATITALLTTRKPTVPMPLATASDTRSMKLEPPA
ncbi:MAG: hypothetical protein ACRDLP_07210 [Solirubrobacteraceae bacterium]